MGRVLCLGVLLIHMLSALSQSAAQTGVFIELNGTRLNNSSVILLTDIGEQLSGPTSEPDTVRGDALVCVTDNPNCCRVADGSAGTTGVGEWLFPGGDEVPGIGGSATNMGIYRNRGTSLVRLNRQADSTQMSIGDYCCELPDRDGDTQRVCVNVARPINMSTTTPTSSTTGPTIDTNTTPTHTSTTTHVTTPMTTSPAGDNSTGLPFSDSTGAVVGGLVGVLIVAVIIIVILVIIVVLVLSKRRRKSNVVAEVEQLQTAMLETKNLSLKAVNPIDQETAYYSTVDASLSEKSKEGGILYSEIRDDFPNQTSRNSLKEEVKDPGPIDDPYYSAIDLKKKNKSGGTGADQRRQTTGSSAVRNGQSGRYVDDDMYAVPNKEPKQSGTNVTAGAEYSEIDRAPPPAIPMKSAQLEEYLETKPLERETLPSGYAEIGVLDKNPTRDVTKSQTLQPLSRPLPNSSMSENPLYATQSFVNRTKSLHLPAENVYEDPTVPSPVVTEEANTENIYETIYNEPIQPSLFTSRATSRDASDNNTTLCPYSSIYTLPAAPLQNGEKPLVITADNIQEVHSLGVGNFGRVILAKTLGLSLKELKMSSSDEDKNVKIYVAVKMLKTSVSTSVRELFEKEYKFMSRLNHPSVIRLLGICTEGTPFIMMEYMEKGDLNQYLQKFNSVVDTPVSGDKHVTTGTLVYIATQIASGMTYLAQQNFVHRDLATRNCLVGQNNVVKIADFGMSRNLYESHYYLIQGHAILPIRWMSTECFYGKFSAKSDVWAFGTAMWEIFTLAKEEPYNGMTDNEVVEDAVKGEGRSQLGRPGACPIDVFRVMEECWVFDSSQRATFEDVFAQLSSLNYKYGSK